jgi:hypothetical protein
MRQEQSPYRPRARTTTPPRRCLPRVDERNDQKPCPPDRRGARTRGPAWRFWAPSRGSERCEERGTCEAPPGARKRTEPSSDRRCSWSVFRSGGRCWSARCGGRR